MNGSFFFLTNWEHWIAWRLYLLLLFFFLSYEILGCTCSTYHTELEFILLSFTC